MFEVKPQFTPDQIREITRMMPHIEQALYHAEQAEIGPEPNLIDLVTKRATYYWVTGRLSLAAEGFERAAGMCEQVFGNEHSTTIVTNARLAAVRAEIAETN